MVFVYIFSRVKSLLLGIFALIRRALCCFSRRRKRSYSECEVLSTVSVVQNDNSSSHSHSRQKTDADRDWNSWDDSPRTVDEHIEQYRQRLAHAKEATPEEPAVDYFQDMTPTIKRQAKLLIQSGNANEQTTNFSRLQATSAAAIPIVQSAELEDWDDDDMQTGWDELSDETTKAMIREKRRELRAQKQQQQHQLRLKQIQMQNSIAGRSSSMKRT